MRRARRWPTAALGALAAAAAVAGVAAEAAAHLPLGERSLVALAAASDAMVLARSLEATVAPAPGGESRTRFAVLEPLAGAVVGGEIAVVGAPPHLRYPALETAIVFLSAAAPGERVRRSPQHAGLRVALAGATLDAGTEGGLRDLWAATHPAPALGEPPAGRERAAVARQARAQERETDARRATAALAALAGGSEPRLRSLAALDLAQMAILHPEDFSAATRERMAAAARAARDEPPVRRPLELALRRLDAAGDGATAGPGWPS